MLILIITVGLVIWIISKGSTSDDLKCTMSNCPRNRMDGQAYCSSHLPNFNECKVDEDKPWSWCAAQGCYCKVRKSSGSYCTHHTEGETNQNFDMLHTAESRTEVNYEHQGQKGAPFLDHLCAWGTCTKRRSPDAQYCSAHLIEFGAYRQRKCGKKERHKTKASAQIHLDDLEQRDWSARGTYTIYECEFCNRFHVGHSKKREWEMQ